MYKLWAVFILITSITAICLSFLAAVEIGSYIRLDSKISAGKVIWAVYKRSPSSFALEARYHFEVQKGQAVGKTIFDKPKFSKAEEAGLVLQAVKDVDWLVYYDRDNLAHSSLQKVFPFIPCIKAFLVWVFFVYLLCLKTVALRVRV
ncbi:MAG: hypothetical protein WCG14_04185 [Chlamydiia bacterium]